MNGAETISKLLEGTPNDYSDWEKVTGVKGLHVWYIPCMKDCLDKKPNSMEVFLSNGWVSVYDNADNATHFYGFYDKAVEYVKNNYKED